MSNKVYLYSLAFIVLVVLPASLWLAAFFSPAYAGKSVPPNKLVVNDHSPHVEYKWLKTPFVRAKTARLFINDVEVKNIKLTKRGIEFNASKLEDGKYTAYALIKYGFPYYKKVRQSWVFEVDTKAPFLDLDFINARRKDNSIATAEKMINLNGKTERGSKMFISGAGTGQIELAVNSSGGFSYELALPQDRNDITMKSVDRAGNVTERKMTAIYDRNSPLVETVSPDGQKLVTGFPSQLSLKATDKESWINNVEFRVEGSDTKIEMKQSPDGLFKGAVNLKDGTCNGKFTVYDAAGHNLIKTVSFEVSTAKIEISRAKRLLSFYLGGKLVKTYRVAVGKPGRSTPSGSFRIVNKRYNPTWINPGSSWAKSMPNRIPPGPDNPLGSRAMDLSVDLIRIHGTPNSGSIGRAASNGCIRMYKWEAEDLYRRVKVGTPVTIY